MDKENKKGKKTNKFQFVSMEDWEQDSIKEEEISYEEENEIEKVETEQVEEKSEDSSVEKIIGIPIPEEESDKEITEKAFDNVQEEIEKVIEKKEKEDIPPKVTTDDVIVDNTKTLAKKVHFSFEARIITMVLLVVAMIIVSFFLMLEAFDFHKKETIHYDEISKANYSVCLKQNEYYDTTCMEENMNYLSSITNNIQLNFQYNATLSQSIQYNLNYYLTSTTKIYERDNKEKVLYKNEEILQDKINIEDEGKDISLSTDISIDYAKYNSNVLNYKNRYSVNADSEVEISLYVEEFGEIRKMGSIIIPLGNSTYEVTKETINNTDRTIEVKESEWSDYNTICITIASILIVVSLFLIYKTTSLVLKVTNNRNKYQQKLTQILREYDRIIVIARNGYESNKTKAVIKVDSFEELLDARDTLQKPIIYSKINDVKSEFIVEDEEKLFKFILKEADFI